MLYIDPGTGAMLFSVLMGIVSAAFFLLQKVILKLKFILSGGKVKTESSDKLPFVIFSDSKRYWNIFEPICDEFERRGIACEYWTASKDDPALSKAYNHVKTKFIGEGNKAYATLNLMNARVCLATTPGLDVFQWKRSKNTDIYVHIVHEIGEVLMYRMFGTDYFDAVLLSGEFQKDGIRKLEELRHLKQKELVVVGSVQMDSMAERKANNPPANNPPANKPPADKPPANKPPANKPPVNNPPANNPLANNPPVVLAAPTWGVSSTLNRFGEQFLQALVDTGYKIIVRPHPQSYISNPELMQKLKEKFPENDMFSWNTDNDNFDVLNQADVLISDFSGIVFDYSVIFDKPVIYANTSLDLAPYDAAWIDEPIWRIEVLPKLGEELKPEAFGDMKTLIDQVLNDEKYQQGRDYVREMAWENKGQAAKNVVDYLTGLLEKQDKNSP